MDAGQTKNGLDKVLLDACFEGNLERARAALDAGANPDCRESGGIAPLMLAAACGCAGAVELLLAAGADPGLASGKGEDALMLAAFNGHPSIVKMLLGAGSDPKRVSKEGLGALGHAVLGKTAASGACAGLLLDAGADPDRADLRKMTPLMRAAQGSAAALEEFAKRQAGDPHRASHSGKTALMLAAAAGKAENVRLMLGYPRQAGQKDADGSCALALAAGSKGADAALCAKILAQAGFSTESRDLSGQTPLFRACGAGSAEAAQALLEAGACPNAVDKWGGTPLGMAVERGCLRTARLLLGAGADPDSPWNFRGNPEPCSFAAVAQGHAEILSALLAAGAALDCKATDGSRLTGLAVERGRAGCLGHLLDHGAADGAQASALLVQALDAGQYEAADELLMRGASLAPDLLRARIGQAAKSSRGQTVALLEAAALRQEKAVGAGKAPGAPRI